MAISKALAETGKAEKSEGRPQVWEAVAGWAQNVPGSDFQVMVKDARLEPPGEKNLISQGQWALTQGAQQGPFPESRCNRKTESKVEENLFKVIQLIGGGV